MKVLALAVLFAAVAVSMVHCGEATIEKRSLLGLGVGYTLGYAHGHHSAPVSSLTYVAPAPVAYTKYVAAPLTYSYAKVAYPAVHTLPVAKVAYAAPLAYTKVVAPLHYW